MYIDDEMLCSDLFGGGMPIFTEDDDESYDEAMEDYNNGEYVGDDGDK